MKKKSHPEPANLWLLGVSVLKHLLSYWNICYSVMHLSTKTIEIANYSSTNN